MIDSIIFDVDGTLWDCTDTVAQAWTHLLQGEPDVCRVITGPELKKLFGKLLSEIGRILFPNCSQERLAQLLDQCYQAEEEALRRNPPQPYEGLEDTLKVLSASYPLYIVSNCQAGYIECFLEVTGLGKYFSGHLCPGDTGQAKAANIRTIMDQNHLQAPIYVGDTQGDFQACREAGIPFVFASYGFGQVDTPDYTIRQPLDLTRLFPR